MPKNGKRRPRKGGEPNELPDLILRRARAWAKGHQAGCESSLFWLLECGCGRSIAVNCTVCDSAGMFYNRQRPCEHAWSVVASEWGAP